MSVTLAAGGAAAQVSPGPLARAHSHLEGAAHCRDCHAAGDEGVGPRCLDCHREIEALVGRDRGIHRADARAACARCHPDHVGVEFDLIAWDGGGPQRFDHERTGFSLEGRHAALECRQCHVPRLQRGEIAALLERKDPSRSWLGLERDCVACHADPHVGELGTECTSCHGLTAWTPARHFDHDRAAYPLTGRHADVRCAACHLVPGRVEVTAADGTRRPRYAPVPHAECSDCHTDPHAATLGPACGSCHVTEGFRIVDREKFDHARTAFPLRGAHARVVCASCHDPRTAWGRKPAAARCDNCHRDAHAGTATLAGRAVDCAACHDERAFRPALYSVADHEGAVYPLVGRHRVVACERCHTRATGRTDELGTARVALRPRSDTCGACHADAHAGQLTAARAQDDCASCHTVDGWRPGTFTADRHRETPLPLAGRHLDADCAACHGAQPAGLPPRPAGIDLGRAGVALAALEPACGSCHLDAHAGRLTATCDSCHTAATFVPSTVDSAAHQRFEYRLEGAHRAAPCFLCHDELREPAGTAHLVRGEGTRRALPFAVVGRRCEDCHDTVHGDQFAARSDRGACEACHTVDAFRPASRFDHERDASFSLRGAHRRVACGECHVAAHSGTTDGDRPVIVYRPLSSRCESCHGPETWKGRAG